MNISDVTDALDVEELAPERIEEIFNFLKSYEIESFLKVDEEVLYRIFLLLTEEAQKFLIEKSKIKFENILEHKEISENLFQMIGRKKELSSYDKEFMGRVYEEGNGMDLTYQEIHRSFKKFIMNNTDLGEEGWNKTKEKLKKMLKE